MSKSKAKRKALLLNAWPEMPQTHRPDVKTWLSLRNGHELTDADTLALMWPNFNCEDLSSKETLLLILHQRARYRPDKFVNLDIGLLNFGMRNGIVGQIDLPGYFAILRDRGTPELYGKLYSYDDEEDNVKREPTRGFYSAGDSYWAVLVQSQLYWILNVICNVILHDLPQDEVWPAEGGRPLPLDLPDYLSKTTVDGIEILSLKAQEEFHKAPKEEPSFARIICFIGAKLHQADDHLWTLREDPNYLIYTAMERMQHMTEMLADLDGNPGPPANVSQQELWGRVVGRLIREAHAQVDLFNILFTKMWRLNDRIVSCCKDRRFHPDIPLEEKLLDDIFSAFNFLISASWELIVTIDLEESAFSSPLMRDSFFRSEEVSHLGHPLMWPRETHLLDCIRDRLIWMFINMAHEHNRFDMGVRGLVTELDLYTRQEPKARALITPYIASQVTTIGILYECLHEMEYLRPWIGGYRTHWMKHIHELTDDWILAHPEETRIGNVKADLWEKAAMCLKVDSKVEHIIIAQESSTPTKEDIDERRSVEEHHDKFWTTLLRGLRHASAVSVYIDTCLSRDKLIRTAPWVEPAKPAKKGKKKKGNKAAADPADPVDPIDQILDEAIAENKKLAQEEVEEPPTKAFEVSKRALKVFRALLFEGMGSYEVSKGIQWNDFVYAMLSIGFKAEKTFGSGWIFTPNKDIVTYTHPILFDEPYMGGEIHYLVTKWYGRRLGRSYNLNIDMFKLSGTQSKESQGSDADSKVESG
ncbi:hypothetical protein F5B19DRAFT_220510 [Rostrohypoxylon terebratum]|nr:hypothetical protein F5B19DRAFT_220510 [Rostrohypoxylon terebratum]